MGRPNKYLTEIKPRLDEIGEWVRQGATNIEIAEALGVHKGTICEYLKLYPEFAETLKKNRMSGIAQVKNALFKKAVGFEYEEKKIYMTKDEDGKTKQHTEITKKQALPDSVAIAMYLRNYDKNFSDSDKFTKKVKEAELELRKQMNDLKGW